MSSQCRVVTAERRVTAVVRATVPFAEIPSAQRAARTKIESGLPWLDVGSLGRTFTRFRMPGDGTLDMEIGTIVARRFAAKDGVEPSELPAGRAARLLLKGSFEQLPQAWPTLFDWCKAQRIVLAGINWEIYGATATDPAQQETELYALLA